MKKELIEKKQNLENELLKINSQINLEILRKDLEELFRVADILSSLYTNKIIEKYADNYFRGSSQKASSLMYDAMKIIDKSGVELGNEIADIEAELESELEIEKN